MVGGDLNTAVWGFIHEMLLRGIEARLVANHMELNVMSLIGIILLEQTPFGVTAFQLLIAGALFLGTGELMRLAAGSRLALHWGLTGCLGSFAVTNLLAREALGAGFEVALACDLVIAADTAEFALPEPRHGLAASMGGLHRLPSRRLLGVGSG